MIPMDPAVATVTSAQATAAAAGLKRRVRETTNRAMQGLAKRERQKMADRTAGNAAWRESASTVACTRRAAWKVGIIANHSAPPVHQAARVVDWVRDFHASCQDAQRPPRRGSTTARRQRVLAGDPAAPVRYRLGNPQARSRAATSLRERSA